MTRVSVRWVGNADRKRRTIVGVELLGHRLIGLLQLLKERRSDGKEIHTGKGLNLSDVTERSSHDDGLVVVLLVVVENPLDRDDTGILITLVGLTRALLVPVEDLKA